MDEEEDERIARRGRGGTHTAARRFNGAEDAALRQAVSHVSSGGYAAFRWDQVVEQLVKLNFTRRTGKSVRNRYLRLTAKPTIHKPEPKNHCRVCGAYVRGHSCLGKPLNPTKPAPEVKPTAEE